MPFNEGDFVRVVRDETNYLDEGCRSLLPVIGVILRSAYRDPITVYSKIWQDNGLGWMDGQGKQNVLIKQMELIASADRSSSLPVGTHVFSLSRLKIGRVERNMNSHGLMDVHFLSENEWVPYENIPRSDLVLNYFDLTEEHKKKIVRPVLKTDEIEKFIFEENHRYCLPCNSIYNGKKCKGDHSEASHYEIEKALELNYIFLE